MEYTSKKQLLDTLTGIIEYDTKFENYYETLVEAINTGNGDTLKKGITDLQGGIQQNQKSAKALIEELMQLKMLLEKMLEHLEVIKRHCNRF